MERIGLYEQTTDFTNRNAGTAEWCAAQKDGKEYFVKKFQKPVYPSQALGLSPEKYQLRVKRFHEEENRYKSLYDALRAHNASGTMVVPEEVVTYQFHICTIAEFLHGNLKPDMVCKLSPWQRLVLMRTLTLAVMNVHEAGIVHGDLKPENLILSQNADNGMCRLHLIDFDGSYFVADAPKRADEILGDMAYWAPEIYAKFEHEEIALDEKIDDFALGILLHYLWCGTLPARPKEQTIGQYVCSGGAVEIDKSRVPLAIAKTIQGLLAAEPAKRISCRQAYDILGVQLAQYPKEIVMLVPDPDAEAPAPEEAPRDVACEKPTEPSEVTVLHVDANGKVLQKTYYKYEGHSEKVFEAMRFDGYTCAGADEVRVRFDKFGIPDQSSVTFRYKKKRAAWAWIIGILAAILIYFLVVGAGYSSAKAQQAWDGARRFAKLIPGFERLFPEEQRSLLAGCYQDAVRSYRLGDYSSAYEVFSWLPQGYEQVPLYRSFCMAHLYGTSGMYEKLLDHIAFEDAADLFVSNSDFVYLYLVGTWQIDGDPSSTMTVTDRGGKRYTIASLIERPGSGTWKIEDGILYFTFDGEDGESIKLHDITIVGKSQMTFRSYRSGKIYTLTRQ